MISNQPLVTGTGVKIWHSNGARGHEYIVLGANAAMTELSLLRNNCINNSGKVHGSTRRVHKTIPISVEIEGESTCENITRVVAQRNFNTSHVARWAYDIAGVSLVKLKLEDNIFPPVGVHDERQSAII